MAKANMLVSSTWTRFIGGVGMAGSLFSCFIVFLFLSNALLQEGAFGVQLIWLFGFASTFLGFYLSIQLYQYGANLKQAIEKNDGQFFALFLQKQKRFWRLTGLSILIGLGLYLLLVLGIVGSSVATTF